MLLIHAAIFYPIALKGRMTSSFYLQCVIPEMAHGSVLLLGILMATEKLKQTFRVRAASA